MRIAQVAPLYESVPPQLYGGAERVVSYLTEELVDLGHHVTLFASGDSVTRAELVPGCARALRLEENTAIADRAHAELLDELVRRRDDFDIIHFHLEDWHLREPRLLQSSHVTTVHAGLDRLATRALFDFPALRLVSVSEAQRRSLPAASWLGTVSHGLPDGLYRPRFERGSYLAFLGRIAPETGIDRALEVARQYKMPLKIAAKIDESDYAYYRSIRPLLRDPQVEFLGEINEAQKSELLASAYALLFPVAQPEPFGLPMIEALACGTPVVAWREGAVPELIDQGMTGFVVNSIEGAVSALTRVWQLDRRLIARIAHQRYSARRMTRDYLRLYARSIARDLTLTSVLASLPAFTPPDYAESAE